MKIAKNALILMAITLVAGIGLGFVYEVTKAPIAGQERQAKEEAYKSVFPGMASMKPVYGLEPDEDAAKVQAESVEALAAAGLEDIQIK